MPIGTALRNCLTRFSLSESEVNECCNCSAMLLKEAASSPSSSSRFIVSFVSHSFRAKAFAAAFNFKIGRTTHLAVRIPRIVAPIKAATDSKKVVRVLALICSIKSDSGTTTTISQSNPRSSLKGATCIKFRLPSTSKVSC